VVLYVFGTSSASTMERVVEQLHQDDRTYIVLVCARNYISLGALLKSHDEIDEYVEMVSQKAQLVDVTVGLMSVTQFPSRRVGEADREEGLSTLDLRIIRSLKVDARRPVEEIAAELNISAATARLRLTHLTKIGAFSASLDWRPSTSGQIVAQLHIRLKEGADRNMIGGSLMSRLASHLVTYVTFSNLPQFLLLVVWARSMRELSQLVALAEGESGVEAVSPNIVITESRFDTWIDKLVARRAGGGRPASAGLGKVQPTD
jgi:DNA-binding Lrp family transcriptional regulator